MYICLRLFPDSRVFLDSRYVRLIASLPIPVLSYVRDRVYPYSRTTVCNSRTSRVRDRVSPDTVFPCTSDSLASPYSVLRIIDVFVTIFRVNPWLTDWCNRSELRSNH